MVDGCWIPPHSSATAPDYIGCLSQMSNSFLASDDGGGGPAAAAAGGMVSRQNSSIAEHTAAAAAMSLPPTPVGSQLSAGSQICTPLDGQVAIAVCVHKPY